MKYRLATALLVLFGIFAVRVPMALAHFPATDKTMTVVLHVDPDDQPVAGQPATLNFLYDDQLKKFNSQNCDCRVSMYEQGRQVFSGLAVTDNEGAIYDGSLPYIFTKADAYTINLSGEPKQSGEFVPFKVSWNVRVTAAPGSGPKDEGYYIMGFIGLVLIGVGAMGYFIYHDFKDA